MAHKELLARASTTIRASRDKVWKALTDPSLIKQYMFGTTVMSEWQTGSPISWKGEWQGKRYEDKGTILHMVAGEMLQYTHFSPLSGQPDIPENYHTVTVRLAGNKEETEVSLTQVGSKTEQERKHSEENWNKMLTGLKQLLEKAAGMD
jgi:uncharacterized protein YndB with AHSA1/START domain